MGDEHLDTIPNVENFVPIPSESEGISNDTCDVPVCNDFSTFDALSNHFQDVILHAKLLNISRLITNIESLNHNPTHDRVLESPSSFPIPVVDSDPFNDDTEETRSGSTTTHANNSLPEYDSFLFEIEPDQGELTNVVIEEVDTFLALEDSIPPGIESNFNQGRLSRIFEASRASLLSIDHKA
ncbi:hypothetical protein Tco_0610539 [Tanacetum coccineum]